MRAGLFGGSMPQGGAQMAAKVLADLQNGYGSAYPMPGLLEPGNINLNTRPQHLNPDGSISTVRSMSAGIDGREYLLPTISDNGDLMSDDDAVQAFIQSGRHLGAFDTPQNADAWAQRLHEEQAAMLRAQRLNPLIDTGGTKQNRR